MKPRPAATAERRGVRPASEQEPAGDLQPAERRVVVPIGVVGELAVLQQCVRLRDIGALVVDALRRTGEVDQPDGAGDQHKEAEERLTAGAAWPGAPTARSGRGASGAGGTGRGAEIVVVMRQPPSGQRWASAPCGGRSSARSSPSRRGRGPRARPSAARRRPAAPGRGKHRGPAGAGRGPRMRTLKARPNSSSPAASTASVTIVGVSGRNVRRVTGTGTLTRQHRDQRQRAAAARSQPAGTAWPACSGPTSRCRGDGSRRQSPLRSTCRKPWFQRVRCLIRGLDACPGSPPGSRASGS